jgi:SPP1 family predicted phage head-tail adaptor
MPRAGLKNRMLFLQKPTRSINSTTGEPEESWVNVGLVYAQVTPDGGTESVESGQNAAEVTHTVRVNYRNDINTQRRFLINGLYGQLNGAITSGTSVVVDDAAFVEFAQTRRVRALRIDDEFMTVSSVSGNTITVVRAAFGSTLANHADNSKVILYRQLNIASVYDLDGRKSDMTCKCVEVT